MHYYDSGDSEYSSGECEVVSCDEDQDTMSVQKICSKDIIDASSSYIKKKVRIYQVQQGSP